METHIINPTIKESGVVIALATVVYALYVQYKPGLGNIWLRTDAENRSRFTPMNLVRMMKRPFHDRDFWRFPNLHMNWVVHVSTFLGGYTLCKSYMRR